MNFFEHQDQAHKLTRRLILLFFLAVICIVIAVNATLAVAWLIAYPGTHQGSLTARLPHHFFLTNTAMTLLFMGGGTLLEFWRLRGGGPVVAEMAGGRLVTAASNDPAERRMLNVAEEMALAAGIAVPRVYVMERETGINAFAAGYSPNEAVVAITRGALTRLSRDELQGVVAHEFSHILNGDMRLNLRLMGVLYGMLLIALFGEQLMSFMRLGDSRSARNGKNNGLPMLALFITGLCLWIVGYIGVFFGRVIKSAVSRQREFLADASAVQFTRNPDGIGSALRKIGGLSKPNAANETELKIGSQINSVNAENLSHLFLGAARANLMSGWLATHPPINERVRRIYGRSMNLLDAPEAPDAYPQAAPSLAPIPYVSSSMADGFAEAAEPLPRPDFPPRTIPEVLRQAARIPITAQQIVLTLLHEHGKHPASLNAIDRQTWLPALQQLDSCFHLPLLDLATPALKLLAPAERERFLEQVDQLIRSDGRITLKEFVLQTILSRRLASTAGRAVPIRYNTLHALQPAITTILSLVAHVNAQGQSSVASQAFAKGKQAIGLTSLDLLPLNTIHFDAVRTALDQINQLAPLQKPALIKALFAASNHPDLSTSSTDLLRAISAALDVPTTLDQLSLQ